MWLRVSGTIFEPTNSPGKLDGPWRTWRFSSIVRATTEKKRAKQSNMEKEFIDRAKAIRQGILQLRDSL
jgi:hypothetical protein